MKRMSEGKETKSIGPIVVESRQKVETWRNVQHLP